MIVLTAALLVSFFFLACPGVTAASPPSFGSVRDYEQLVRESSDFIMTRGLPDPETDSGIGGGPGTAFPIRMTVHEVSRNSPLTTSPTFVEKLNDLYGSDIDTISKMHQSPLYFTSSLVSWNVRSDFNFKKSIGTSTTLLGAQGTTWTVLNFLPGTIANTKCELLVKYDPEKESRTVRPLGTSLTDQTHNQTSLDGVTGNLIMNALGDVVGKRGCFTQFGELGHVRTSGIIGFDMNTLTEETIISSDRLYMILFQVAKGVRY